MSLNLMQASTQWMNRPDDERFWTVQEMLEATKRYADNSRETSVRLHNLEARPFEAGFALYSKDSDKPAVFSHYSFGQLCNLIKAPASYLRSLPGETVATLVNHGIQQRAKDETSAMQVLMHRNGVWTMRAITSTHYDRVWNWELCTMLDRASHNGWVVPPARPVSSNSARQRPATESDVLRASSHSGLGIKVGDMIAPAGLYASDKDMFAFMVNENIGYNFGNGETLYRGFFISNSEVGDAYLRVTMFYYDTVCGNHIVWGAKNVREVKIKHMGQKAEQFKYYVGKAIKGIENSGHQDLLQLEAARTIKLGSTKEEVLKVAATKFGFTQKDAESVYAKSIEFEDIHGDPRTVWGFTSGVTRYSQQTPYADKRDELDRKVTLILDTTLA